MNIAHRCGEIKASLELVSFWLTGASTHHNDQHMSARTTRGTGRKVRSANRPSHRRDPGMKLLEERLRRNGVTLGWLAKELQLKRQSVYVWEKVPDRRLADVVRVTGIPAKELRPDLRDLLMQG